MLRQNNEKNSLICKMILNRKSVFVKMAYEAFYPIEQNKYPQLLHKEKLLLLVKNRFSAIM